MEPEQALWQAVLYQSFVDATHPDPTNTEALHAKQDADDWIRGNRKDFRRVCSMAGMDPDFLSEAYVKGRVDRALLKAAQQEGEAEDGV